MARDTRIDALKGLLIILVILGHVITHLDNANPVNHAVMGVIYIFHMPLFVMLSGYFSKRPDNCSSVQLWREVLSLFTTVIIFHVLYSLWTGLLGFSFTQALKGFPYGILWYLQCLIYWKLSLYYTPRSLYNKPWLHLGIALAVSLLSGLTHLGNTLAIQRALNFYVFFLFGHYYSHGAISTSGWNKNGLLGAITVTLLPVIFVLLPHCGNIMNGADHYEPTQLPQKALILLCSISTSMLVFNLMKPTAVLSGIGKESLHYYLYHVFIIQALVMVNVRTGYALPTTFPFIIAYTIITVAVLFLMGKIKLFKRLTRPLFKDRAVN